MKITILTLFPEFFSAITENTIIKRAISKEKVVLNIVNIREYTKDKHRRVDSAPIGGGAGLIMKCQPIVDALNLNCSTKAHKILLSPRGKTFNQKMAESYSQLDELVIICGHYEGIDERVNNYVDELVSTGDYVLTGGEIPSMLIVDSIVRLLDGVINRESIIDESFESGMLEYPQYTEPRNFEGYEVPEILYSGNHGKIDRYRYLQALKITKQYRPDLFEKLELSKKDIEELQEILENN
jgi:tRNA (guanine37-N1)-methyltransferase